MTDSFAFQMAIDIACSHSYLGWSRLQPVLRETRAAGALIDISFLPAQIAPDAPVDPEPLDAVHARVFGPGAKAQTEAMTRAAAAEGIELRYDRAQFTNTRRAHLLLARAQTQGLGEEAVTELFAAYFRFGRNVSDPSVLREIAASIGLDYGGGTTAAEEAALDKALAHTRDLGIRSLPTLITPAGGRYSGALQREQYSTLLRDSTSRSIHQSAS
ncbi:DsbA family protein [Micromonospora sp. NPDC047670]|uniref:DsbA family oxidoreductase n=1 Tax=Micromonospora sp. NPDC047670 TaxID=3364252 RepID=UPI0037198509